MKVGRAAVLVLALAVGSVGAVLAGDETAERTAAMLAQKALTNSGALGIVTDLTTEIGPRLAGSEAEKRAADWAKSRFEQLGCDKVWIETFPIEHGWMRGTEAAEVVGPISQRLMITALGGSGATPKEGIEAEIALFRSYDELLVMPMGSLAGKIAVVTQAIPRNREGTGYFAGSKIRSSGPTEAARRGAIAFLLRSLGTSNHRFPHTGLTRYTNDIPRIPAAALSAPDAEQLERLSAKGKPVRIKLILTPRVLGPVTSQNVIAEIRGREKPDEIVMLGAHLDSWDLGTGALDDGAGVAMVMAATKLIRELPQRPKRTIRVVLFGAEETGLHGAKAYAEAHKGEAVRHVVATEPDVGQGPVYAFQTGVANPDEPSLKRVRAALLPLGIVADNNQSRGSSDVGPMFGLGVPAVTLKLDATDYFDFHHSADDTLDKIQPERINQSTAAYTVFAYLAAELGGNYRATADSPTR